MTPPPRLTAGQQADVAKALISALDEVARVDARMPIGRLIALLAVAAHNGDAVDDNEKLPQTELWAAAGGEALGAYNTFSAHLKELSTRVLRVGGSTPRLGWVELHQNVKDWRASSARLTPSGKRLVASITGRLARSIERTLE